MNGRHPWHCETTSDIPTDRELLTDEHLHQALLEACCYAVLQPRIYSQRTRRWLERILPEFMRLREENEVLREQLAAVREAVRERPEAEQYRSVS